jgi:Metallo-beta-lactamase superfamily
VELTVGPYVAAGQVKTFEGATELFPGLRMLPAYGHTPGHTYYVLEDGGEKLVFMGDTIHAPDAQFDDPDITIEFDVDQKQAAATRKKAFADACGRTAARLQSCGDHVLIRRPPRVRWIGFSEATYSASPVILFSPYTLRHSGASA